MSEHKVKSLVTESAKPSDKMSTNAPHIKSLSVGNPTSRIHSGSIPHSSSVKQLSIGSIPEWYARRIREEDKLGESNLKIKDLTK